MKGDGALNKKTENSTIPTRKCWGEAKKDFGWGHGAVNGACRGGKEKGKKLRTWGQGKGKNEVKGYPPPPLQDP